MARPGGSASLLLAVLAAIALLGSGCGPDPRLAATDPLLKPDGTPDDEPHFAKYRERAQRRFDAGDLDGALADASVSIELQQDRRPTFVNETGTDYAPLVLRSRIHARQGRLEQGRADLERAFALACKPARPFEKGLAKLDVRTRGDWLVALGRLAEAEAAAAELMKRGPPHAEFADGQELLARVYLAR